MFNPDRCFYKPLLHAVSLVWFVVQKGSSLEMADSGAASWLLWALPTFAFMGPFFHKKNFKWYDYIGLKMNIIQADFDLFFSSNFKSS